MLEAEPDAPVPRGHVRHVPALEVDGASIGPLQAGHDPQQRRLAAAARPEEGGERTGLDLEGHIVDGNGISKAFGERSDGDAHRATSLCAVIRRSVSSTASDTMASSSAAV